MAKDPVVYLRHIEDCMQQILEYTHGMELADFLRNRMTQDAVIRNLEVMGEAAKNIDTEFRQKYPEVEWRKMAGMRDKLIHEYMAVDKWAVWEVVKNVLPELLDEIRQMILLESDHQS